MEKRVKITIAPDGNFEVDATGFEGEACRHTTEILAQCVNGCVSADEDRECAAPESLQFLRV